MTKLLILSSDTGEGHNSAAAAIESAASSAGLEVKLRKPLEESTIVNRSLAGFYNTLLTHRPQWMGTYSFLAKMVVDSWTSDTTKRRSPARGGPSIHST